MDNFRSWSEEMEVQQLQLNRQLLRVIGSQHRGQDDEQEIMISTLQNLVSHGADINFKEVVQWLVENGATVPSYNVHQTTPLDIFRDGKQLLVNEMIKISQKILTDTEVDVLSQKFGATTLIQAQTQTPTGTTDTKKISEVKKNMVHCLQSLEGLKIDKSTKNLSYKQANVLNCFLETFALQGEGSKDKKKKDEVTEYFSKYFSEEDRKIVASARIQLFKGSESETDKKIDGNKGPSTKQRNLITLQHFLSFVKGGDVPSFFENMKKYVQQVLSAINSDTRASEIRDKTELTSFLNSFEKEDKVRGQEIPNVKTFLEKELENLTLFAYLRFTKPSLPETGENRDETKEELDMEELLFNFTINVYPTLKSFVRDNSNVSAGTGFTTLRHMRNMLIHEPHHYGAREFRRDTFTYRSILFKYLYAQQVYSVLESMKPNVESTKIAQDLCEKLTNFQKSFEQTEQTLSSKFSKYLAAEEEVGNCFEYKFLKSSFPERDDEISKLVHQYLKFMIITEGPQIELPHDDDDDHGNKGSLGDAERRQIFERFLKLKQISNMAERQEELIQFRLELCQKYFVSEQNFNEVVQYFVDKDTELGLGPEQNHELQSIRQIADILIMLKNLKRDYRFSGSDIIYLYNQAVTQQANSDFKLDEHARKLHCNINDLLASKASIEDKLNRLRHEIKVTKLNFLIGTKTMTIDLITIVGNMLKTFYCAYGEYRINFNDVDEAFNDEHFIQFFISICQSAAKSPDLLKEDSLYKIVKKLIKIDYAAPFIAALVKLNSDIIEKDDLVTLVNTLVGKQDLYVAHLSSLLKTFSGESTSSDPPINLYEIVCNHFVLQNILSVQSLALVLKEPENAVGFLNILKKFALKPQLVGTTLSDTKIVEFLNKILKLCNTVALEWSYTNGFEEALKILNCVHSTCQSLVEGNLMDKNDSDFLDNVMITAKMYINQGALLPSRSCTEKEVAAERRGKFEKACETLLNIINADGIDEECPQFFVALNCLAYSYSELGDYEKGYEVNEKERERLVKFVLNLKDTATPALDRRLYSKIVDSEKYKMLLKSSVYSKYLDILYIEMGSILYRSKIKVSDVVHQKKVYEDYVKLYDITLYAFGQQDKKTVQVLRSLAYTGYGIAEIMRKQRHNYLDALPWYFDSISKWHKILQLHKAHHGSHHGATAGARTGIVKNSIGLALSYKKCSLGWNNDEKLRVSKVLVEIWGSIYNLQKHFMGESHLFTLLANTQLKNAIKMDKHRL